MKEMGYFCAPFKNRKKLEDFRNIRIADYNYHLPDSRIAKYPLAQRDESKLIVWQKGEIAQDVFKNVTQYIPQNSTLVFNNTKVIHARLFFRKETGAKIEIFCLEPVEPADYQIAFQEKEKVTWKCMVGNARKWKNERLRKEILFNGKEVVIEAIKKKQTENSFHIEFVWNGGLTFAEIIENAGVLPIPPYLNRETEQSDEETYQTNLCQIRWFGGSANGRIAFYGINFKKFVSEKYSDKRNNIACGRGHFSARKIGNHFRTHDAPRAGDYSAKNH